MSWTIHYQPIRNERADNVLLTLGRAIYAASQFEGKCQYVLRIIKLVDTMHPDKSADPVMGLEEAITSLPRDQVLARALQQLAAQMPAKKSEAELLQAAKQARNFIAHEGASFGLHPPAGQQLVEHLDKLHDAVRDLAAGDNLISLWALGIDEPRATKPSPFIAAYEDALVRWILGPVWDLLTDPSVDPSVPDDGQVHERMEHYRAAYPHLKLPDPAK